MYCCCDPDCSSVERSLFQACLKSNPLDNQIEYCTLATVKINSAATNAILKRSSSGSCVVFNNIDSNSGLVFSDPGNVGNDVTIWQLVSAQPFKFSLGSLLSDNSAFTPPDVYLAGTPVFARYSKVGNAGALGVFSVPISLDGQGFCDNSSPALFLLDTNEKCSRKLTGKCTGGDVFDVNTYLQAIRFPSSPKSTDYIPISIRNFYCDDSFCCLSNGALTSCNKQDDLTALHADPDNLAIPQPVLVSGTCTNAFSGMNVTISYQVSDSQYSITGVTADLFFKSTSNDILQQEFSVWYVKADATVVFAKSGSPGYIIGAPVMAGTLVTASDNSAVDWSPGRLSGITLPTMRSDNNLCTGKTLSDLAYRVPVAFGEDLVTGCSLTYSFSDLTNNCAAIRSNIFDYQMGSTNSLFNRIGRYGNSSVQNIQDWVELMNTVPDSTLTSSNSGAGDSGTCSDLLTEFNIQFLTLPIGTVSNPQMVILGARYEFISGQFSFRCVGSSCFNDKQPQKFTIRSSITFVRASNSGFTSSSSSSSLNTISIPSDVFYPFWYQRTSGADRLPYGILPFLAPLLVVVMFM